MDEGFSIALLTSIHIASLPPSPLFHPDIPARSLAQEPAVLIHCSTPVRLIQGEVLDPRPQALEPSQPLTGSLAARGGRARAEANCDRERSVWCERALDARAPSLHALHTHEPCLTPPLATGLC